jgi:hypothetical protein
MERAAAELRRLAAVEAERDDLKLALAHTVRLVQDWTQSAYAMEAERDAMRLDYSRLLEKHNNLHANAARDRAERDALLAARTSPAHQPAHGWTDAEREPLTDEQINAMYREFMWYEIDHFTWGVAEQVVRAIERAHGIGGAKEST